MRAQAIIVGVLIVAVVASALGVVHSKHRSRRLFVQLQELRSERDQLDVEWGRLRLEQSAWATHGRVERVARDELEMTMPPQDQVIIVTLPPAGASNGDGGRE